MSLEPLQSWFAGHAAQIPLTTQPIAAPNFQWSSIPASTDLVWHDCFDGFQCSKLQVSRLLLLSYFIADENLGTSQLARARGKQCDFRYRGHQGPRYCLCH